MEKTNNFLNNQRYILGRKEKDREINKFLFLNITEDIFKYLNFLEKKVTYITLTFFPLIIWLYMVYIEPWAWFVFIILLFFIYWFNFFLKQSINQDYNYFDNNFVNTYLKLLLNYFFDIHKISSGNSLRIVFMIKILFMIVLNILLFINIYNFYWVEIDNYFILFVFLWTLILSFIKVLNIIILPFFIFNVLIKLYKLKKFTYFVFKYYDNWIKAIIVKSIAQNN